MNSRYSIISTRKTKKGKTIYSQVYYPTIGYREDDIYIITKTTDRFDLIALDFWGDVRYWWLLPKINNLECDSIYPAPGIQLRIPSSPQEYINLYKQENSI